MRILFIRLIGILVFYSHLSQLLGSEATTSLPNLPTVAQDSDVHMLAKGYCNALWKAVTTQGLTGYQSRNSQDFKASFMSTVDEITTLLSRVKNTPSLNSKKDIDGMTSTEKKALVNDLLNSVLIVQDKLILDTNCIDRSLFEVDKEEYTITLLYAVGIFYDRNNHTLLATALKKMGTLGKHDGQEDFDKETSASVNEILVYAWHHVKTEPKKYLIDFLIGLTDAAPTCIQGHSVRMLCAIHPPRLKVTSPSQAVGN